MANYITNHFSKKYGKRPDNILELEFEKSFSKIILYAKKRYVGWKWELKYDKALDRKVMKRKQEPDASGMETERRDSTLLVSQGVRDVLRILLSDDGTRTENLERVRQYIVDDMVAPLESGTVDWNLLIQSKQFRMRASEYMRRGQIPPIHIQLAQKLDRRYGVGSEGTYRPGDRVQYVVVEEQLPDQKTSELAEDPEYAWNHHMCLSKKHYIENQVHGTMARVLEPVLAPPDHFRSLITSVIIIDDDKSKEQRRRRAMTNYKSFIRAKAAKRQHILIGGGGGGGGILAAFVSSTQQRCRLCGVPVATSDKDAVINTICEKHTAMERRQFTDDRVTKMAKLHERGTRIFRTCIACSQQWRIEDDEKRALQLPELQSSPVVTTIEETISCGNKYGCDVYWQRRTIDRMFATSLNQN